LTQADMPGSQTAATANAVSCFNVAEAARAYSARDVCCGPLAGIATTVD
jgi:hypothetical protein